MDSMEKIISLAKRRGFIFPGSEIYGGLANSWDYGSLGVELKNNIKQAWWKRFVHERSDVVGIDPAIIMNPKVWEASGHLKEFSDPLVECKKCHMRFRQDAIPSRHSEQSEESRSRGDMRRDSSAPPQNDFVGECPNCDGSDFASPKQFNLLFKTFLGPVEDAAATAYLRGELAQAMFVNFKNVLDTNRKRVPFGIAAQGKVFRNEITPGNFIFRTREFDLMELEYFVRPPAAASRTNADVTRNNAEKEEWEIWFDYWLGEMKRWLRDLGVSEKKLHFTDIPDGERAHYSKRTIDIEYDYPFGQKEIYGLAYRTDFDLKRHQEASGVDLTYTDPDTKEKFLPHVIEPTFGLDRTFLVVLLEAYREEGDRKVLALPKHLAPYKAAVFPLLANKPALVQKASEIYQLLITNYQLLPIAFDDRGNIGKRYYSQDEIGTPFCITVDFDTLGDGDDKKLKDTVTVRDRDTMKQERVPIAKLDEYLKQKLVR